MYPYNFPPVSVLQQDGGTSEPSSPYLATEFGRNIKVTIGDLTGGRQRRKSGVCVRKLIYSQCLRIYEAGGRFRPSIVAFVWVWLLRTSL